MKVNNPDYEVETRRVFDQAPFIQWLGAELVEFRPGYCLTRIPLQTTHRQQDGFVHAGVQATLADHSCGTAAATLIASHERVLTADFTVNLLRPASGHTLECEARVIKQGKTLTVAEGEVYALSDAPEQRKLVAKATVTLAIVSAG
ncbi:MAG: PaaI family thioesterase [Oceanobacter sp.]